MVKRWGYTDVYPQLTPAKAGRLISSNVLNTVGVLANTLTDTFDALGKYSESISLAAEVHYRQRVISTMKDNQELFSPEAEALITQWKELKSK